VKAIVQGLIGHTGIEPKAFFNAIGQKPPRRSLAAVTGLHPIVLQKSFCTGAQKF
jgi:hypothetical protein